VQDRLHRHAIRSRGGFSDVACYPIYRATRPIRASSPSGSIGWRCRLAQRSTMVVLLVFDLAAAAVFAPARHWRPRIGTMSAEGGYGAASRSRPRRCSIGRPLQKAARARRVAFALLFGLRLSEIE